LEKIFVFDGYLRRRAFGQTLDERRRGGGRKRELDRLIERVVVRKPASAPRCRVRGGKDVAAVGGQVDERDAIKSVLKDVAIALLAFMQRSLGPLALFDVEH